MKKTSGPKKRKITVVGSGWAPHGTVAKAIRSQRAGRKREFTAIDREKALVKNIANALGIAELPNLKFITTDAIREVEKMSPESQDVIFGSYFMSNLGKGIGKTFHIQFFVMAARSALKERGRLILIEDKQNRGAMQRLASRNGMKLSVIELNDEKATQSLSQAIKARASKAERTKHSKYANDKSKNGTTYTPEDFRPTIYILRKPQSRRQLLKGLIWKTRSRLTN